MDAPPKPAPSTSSSANVTGYQQMPPPANPVSSIPSHTRTASVPTVATTPTAKGKAPLGLVAPSRPNNATPATAGPSRTGLNTPIQTPVHQQLQQNQAHGPNRNTSSGLIHQQPEKKQPPPQPQQAAGPSNERRLNLIKAINQHTTPPSVYAAPAVRKEPSLDEESFGMNSDDDALFASVDLGEMDSGIGGHIDFDEGTGGVHDENDSLEDRTVSSLTSVLPEKQEMRAPQAQGPQRAQQVNQQFNPPQQPRQTAQPSVHTRNGIPANQTARNSSTVTSKPPTPSMGSFHFPAGVVRSPILCGLRPSIELNVRYLLESAECCVVHL